jgi:hypothetical protein
MSNEDPSAGILEAFKKSSFDITTTLQPLHTDLLFLKDAISLVVGESKAGKTYTTIKSLVDCGFKDQIIHLDFDRNSDQKLKELDVRTYHIKSAKELYLELSKSANNKTFENSLHDKILVIDSLQDLAYEFGLDANQGALSTIGYATVLKATGATLIIIHHVTMDSNGKPKVKGNASVITAKCDTTILFQKINNTKRTMTVLNTRTEDKIPSGTMISYTSDDQNQDQQITSKPKRQNSRVPS